MNEKDIIKNKNKNNSIKTNQNERIRNFENNER